MSDNQMAETDEFYGSIWWVSDGPGKLRSATPGEASREIERLKKENDNLRALIGAQDTHNCEHDGCMQSELGTNGYRAEAKVWVDKYYAMKRRLEELGESM